MKLSEFGRKFEKESGIGRLMNDLVKALTGPGEKMMLGGGNPARIPDAEKRFRKLFEKTLSSEENFARTFGIYSQPQGHRQFIEALAALLTGELGRAVEPDNIALTTGTQSAFFLLFNMFAGKTPDGFRKVLLPVTPEYIGYMDLGLSEGFFNARKPQIELVGEKEFKYRIDFENLDLSDIGVACVSRPTNPTGNVLSKDEIERLSNLARENDFPVIIDSAYGNPFPGIIYGDDEPIYDENTILCLSLSKLGLPAVRTGIVVGPTEVIQLLSRMNAVFSLAPGSLGAALILDIVQSGEILKISREIIRPFYAKRRLKALFCIEKYLDGINYRVHRAEGGFFLWLWFPDLKIKDHELYDRLKARNVIVVPGHYFFPGLEEWAHSSQCLRLTYAQDPESVEMGIRILADEVKKVS